MSKGMEMNDIKHVLFDLDGTLLPMVQDEFVKYYSLFWRRHIEAPV